jgi:hypothetical protein
LMDFFVAAAPRSEGVCSFLGVVVGILVMT